MKRKSIDQFRTRLQSHICIYCGGFAESDDHFPSLNVSKFRGWLLPACNECNDIAHTNFSFDFLSRFLFVKNRLKRKYKKILNIPDWSDDELESMSLNMKENILQSIRYKSQTQARIDWDYKPFLATFDEDIDELL